MSKHGSDPLGEALQRQRAISRWEGEGGAVLSDLLDPDAIEGKSHLPKMGEAEIAALHVRVIALENLVIALLSAPPDRKLEVAREMAAYISPRPGFTRHPLTIHAATHMLDLVERAARFEGRQP
jgi:hypothetical protein